MSARTFQLEEKKKNSSFPPRGCFVVFFKSGQGSEFLILWGFFSLSQHHHPFLCAELAFSNHTDKLFQKKKKKKSGSVFPLA